MEDELVRRLRPLLPYHPELPDLMLDRKVEASRHEVLRRGRANPEPGDSMREPAFSSEDLDEEHSSWRSQICCRHRLMHSCGRTRVGRAIYHPGPRSPSLGDPIRPSCPSCSSCSSWWGKLLAVHLCSTDSPLLYDLSNRTPRTQCSRAGLASGGWHPCRLCLLCRSCRLCPLFLPCPVVEGSVELEERVLLDSWGGLVADSREPEGPEPEWTNSRAEPHEAGHQTDRSSCPTPALEDSTTSSVGH